jgi:hypothetical protein
LDVIVFVLQFAGTKEIERGETQTGQEQGQRRVEEQVAVSEEEAKEFSSASSTSS